MDLDVGRGLVQRWRTADADTAQPMSGAVPLSKAQRGILVFEGLNPGTAVFNLRFAARHCGPLDEAQLDRALAALLRRHPNLRSRFRDGDDGPVRHIEETAELAVRWTDLRTLPPERREGAALEFI